MAGGERRWAGAGCGGVVEGGCCSEMGPNLSMIFLLFLICYKPGPAPKRFPVSCLESLLFAAGINIQIG